MFTSAQPNAKKRRAFQTDLNLSSNIVSGVIAAATTVAATVGNLRVSSSATASSTYNDRGKSVIVNHASDIMLYAILCWLFYILIIVYPILISNFRSVIEVEESPFQLLRN